MRIEERTPCPRCGHRRVGERSRGVYVCFQCRHSWSGGPAGDPVAYFSPDQRRRLLVYRAAIRAGVYSDWEGVAA